MKHGLSIVRWVLVAPFAASFAFIGWGKFTDPGWITAFEQWGYPSWMRLMVGILEIGAAGLLVVPRWARFGGAIVALVMIGALLTHAVHGNHPSFPAAQMAGFYFLLAAGVLLLSRRRSKTDGAGR